MGQRKPNPAGYHDIARRFGVAPDECLYVGDGGGSELTGAARVGMTPVLLTPLDDDFRYDAEADWSSRSIAHLDDLWRVLREALRGT